MVKNNERVNDARIPTWETFAQLLDWGRLFLLANLLILLLVGGGL